MKEEDIGWNYEDLDWKEGFVLKDWPGLKESFDEMAWMKQKISLKNEFSGIIGKRIRMAKDVLL